MSTTVLKGTSFYAEQTKTTLKPLFSQRNLAMSHTCEHFYHMLYFPKPFYMTLKKSIKSRIQITPFFKNYDVNMFYSMRWRWQQLSLCPSDHKIVYSSLISSVFLGQVANIHAQPSYFMLFYQWTSENFYL